MSDDIPHDPPAPDLQARDTLDEGFSAGWLLHAQPAELTIIDAHSHMFHTDTDEILAAVDEWHERMFPYRLGRQIGYDGYPHLLDAFSEASRRDPRFQFLMRLRTDQTVNPDDVLRAKQLGAVGVKLHNQRLMRSGGDPALYFESPWREVLQACQEHRMPIVWHVTQRYSREAYTGGGYLTNWNEQPDFDPDDHSTIRYGNRAHLAVFEQILADYPDLQIVGAHQLHVGYPKIEELLDRYPNFHYDFSVNGFVRWGDQMRPADVDFIRRHMCRYADRVLFGTDVHFNPGRTYWRVREQHFLGHVRFVRQLRLPDEVLQIICWRNAERLFHLPPLELDSNKWGYLRP